MLGSTPEGVVQPDHPLRRSKPGQAVIRYTIPTPQDGPLHGADVSEVELSEGARRRVPFGRPRGTVLRTFVWEVAL